MSFPRLRVVIAPCLGLRKEAVLTVHLIRHGQGTHNTLADTIGDSAYEQPETLDAALTTQGETEARDAGLSLQERSIDMVFVSPLTRTLETATLAFPRNEGAEAPALHVLWNLREGNTYGKHPCNVGKTAAELEIAWPHVSGFEHCRDMGYSELETEAELDGRVHDVLEHLARAADQGLREVAVVTHCVWLAALWERCSKHDQARDSPWWQNGEVRSVELEFVLL